MNTQRRCGRVSKITENGLAVLGHMEHYNISNVTPTVWNKVCECKVFLLQPFNSSINKSENIAKRQPFAGQCTVKLLLVLKNAHNPIDYTSVQISYPRKQNTLLLRNFTTDRHTISHHDGCHRWITGHRLIWMPTVDFFSEYHYFSRNIIIYLIWRILWLKP